MKNNKTSIKHSLTQASEQRSVRRIDRIRTDIKAGSEYVDPSGQMKVIYYGEGAVRM